MNPLPEHINLANCVLSNLQIIGVFQVLRNTSLLTYLDTSHNEVTKKAANELSFVIMNNKLLQYLNLSACNCQEDTLILIVDSLARITSLVSLDVSYNCITENAAHIMATALRKNSGLKQLNFCACFEDNAALIIFNAISQHKAITYLNINLNVFNSDLADLIVSTLMNKTKVEHLDFGQCDLQESEFMQLLNGLENATTLQYLNLEGNKISEDLVPKITSLICQNRSLKYINLCNCNIPMVKVQNIFHAIGKLHSVETLKLSGNQISNWACTHLKDALSKNIKIRCVDCSGCQIRGKGTCALLMSFNSSTCLESLNLQSCFLNDHSASMLLPTIIINNKSLKYLNLTNCKLPEKGLTAIAKALQETTAIKHLLLSSNDVSNAVSQEIALAVNKNCK